MILYVDSETGPSFGLDAQALDDVLRQLVSRDCLADMTFTIELKEGDRYVFGQLGSESRLLYRPSIEIFEDRIVIGGMENLDMALLLRLILHSRIVPAETPLAVMDDDALNEPQQISADDTESDLLGKLETLSTW